MTEQKGMSGWLASATLVMHSTTHHFLRSDQHQAASLAGRGRQPLPYGPTLPAELEGMQSKTAFLH